MYRSGEEKGETEDRVGHLYDVDIARLFMTLFLEG